MVLEVALEFLVRVFFAWTAAYEVTLAARLPAKYVQPLWAIILVVVLFPSLRRWGRAFTTPARKPWFYLAVAALSLGCAGLQFYTRLIDVEYLSPDPQLAAAVVNHLLQGLIEKGYRARYNATMQASSWLTTQLEDLRAKTQELQAKVVKLQQASGVFALGEVDREHVVADEIAKRALHPDALLVPRRMERNHAGIHVVQ